MVNGKENDVITMYVAHVDDSGGSNRPALVRKLSDNTLEFYKITTRYKDKSENIKAQYYEIKDLKQAHLYKQSYIDLGTVLTIKASESNFKKIGTLSKNDIKGMYKQANGVVLKRSKRALGKKLKQRISNICHRYINDQHIPRRKVREFEIIDKVTDEQLDLGIEEFTEIIRSEYNVNSKQVEEKASEYIRENYDNDYLYMKVEAQIDQEKIQKELKDDLVSELLSTPPYNQLERSYWVSRVNMLESIKELDSFAKTEDLEGFAGKYAPEWKELREE